MKCKAKRRNGEDCKANAMRGGKYCYIHSFGRLKEIPWYKNFTIHSVTLGAIAIFIMINWGATKGKQRQISNEISQIPEKTSKLLKQKQLDQSKIFLGIRYAYEFDNYAGATNTFGNEDRKIDPDTPLKKRYNPDENIKFVFLIDNENKEIPFDDVYLEIIMPDEILEVTCGEGWQVQRINKRYTYHFPQINNKPLNTHSPIWVKFPEPGKYVLSCSIDGRDIATIDIPVKIELY